MKQLKKDLQSVVKGLRSLSRKTEKIAKKLERLENARPAKKVRAKRATKAAKKAVPKKTERVTASDTLLATIRRRRKGVDTAALKKMTGFDDKKIWNIVNRLKQEGKIKSKSRGLYVRV